MGAHLQSGKHRCGMQHNDAQQNCTYLHRHLYRLVKSCTHCTYCCRHCNHYTDCSRHCTHFLLTAVGTAITTASWTGACFLCGIRWLGVGSSRASVSTRFWDMLGSTIQLTNRLRCLGSISNWTIGNFMYNNHICTVVHACYKSKSRSK